eukprot:scaffold76001_cov30-Tisochrysis_lutea.AAC.6
MRAMTCCQARDRNTRTQNFEYLRAILGALSARKWVELALWDQHWAGEASCNPIGTQDLVKRSLWWELLPRSDDDWRPWISGVPSNLVGL